VTVQWSLHLTVRCVVLSNVSWMVATWMQSPTLVTHTSLTSRQTDHWVLRYRISLHLPMNFEVKTIFLQYFDAVDWVYRPVKLSPGWPSGVGGDDKPCCVYVSVSRCIFSSVWVVCYGMAECCMIYWKEGHWGKPRSKDPSSTQLILHRCLSWITPLSWWSLSPTWDAELMHAEEVEILRRIEMARGCKVSLTKNIWRSSITQSVKIRLYNTYVLPVLLYGSELWDVTVKSGKRLDAFDQWCLWHILQVPFTAHVTNQEIRIRSAQPPVTQTIMARRLRFFGHIVRSDSDEDHTRALNAGIDDPPKDRRSAEGVETTSRSPSSNTAVYDRERPQTTEPGAVVCQAQSIWPWTVAWNRGNSNAPAGASYVMNDVGYKNKSKKKVTISRRKEELHRFEKAAEDRSVCRDNWIDWINFLLVLPAVVKLICVVIVWLRIAWAVLL